MLKRLYVHNYRCLVNFEFQPQQVQLLVGANGSGKSTVFEVLDLLRRFALERETLPPGRATRTRWLAEEEQRFEMEVAGNGGSYIYAVVGNVGDDRNGWIQEEKLQFNGETCFRADAIGFEVFQNGKSQIRGGGTDGAHSFLQMGSSPEPIRWFCSWLGGMRLARVNPWAVTSTVGDSGQTPGSDFRNLAGWYKRLLEQNRETKNKALAAIRELIPGLEDLSVTPPTQHSATVQASFRILGGGLFQMGLEELSEGQRALIALYLLIADLRSGELLLVDEPDNFVSLREIQPWLMQAITAVEDADAQMIVASHHPELLNQLSTDALVLSREEGGATLIKPFPQDSLGLSPAELVARGWEGE